MGFIHGTTQGATLISSQWRNRIQNFNFSNLLENSEIKRQPIGNRRNEKKNSSSGNKLL